MGIFSTTEFNSLEELFEHELKDLYDAEHRLTDALPQLADKATNAKLKLAFENHLRETETPRRAARIDLRPHRRRAGTRKVRCDGRADQRRRSACSTRKAMLTSLMPH